LTKGYTVQAVNTEACQFLLKELKAIATRLRRLEDRFGPEDGKPRLILVVCPARWGLALDQDTCIQILDECGFLPTGPVGVINLGKIPVGLNADELEQYLREHGAGLRLGPATDSGAK
jgi:hypothetical protein